MKQRFTSGKQCLQLLAALQLFVFVVCKCFCQWYVSIEPLRPPPLAGQAQSNSYFPLYNFAP
jgi:hypothetical protein